MIGLLSLDGNEKNIRFERLVAICKELFGKPGIKGSHHIFKTPWIGDPRINLQSDKGAAKPYQVRQVLLALRRLKATSGNEERNGKT